MNKRARRVGGRRAWSRATAVALLVCGGLVVCRGEESRSGGGAVPPDFVLSEAVEWYGNFETAGVIFALPAGLAAEQIGRMRCFLNVGGEWRPAHDLVQVGTFPWFAGSLFWLHPGSNYQVKVVAEDGAGTVLGSWCGEGATRAEPVAPPEAQTLWVATSGDDANAGTREQPLRTLRHALALADAGTTVLVRGGTYYEGQLEFAHNGTAEAPIVLKAWAGEQVLVDGADPELLDAAAWSLSEEGLYHHALTGESRNVSLEEKATGRILRLYPVRSLDELRTRTIRGLGLWSSFGVEGAYHCDGATATLAVPGRLENYRVHVAKQTKAFIIENRRFLQIVGLDIVHMGKGAFATAAMVYDSDDILIQQCRIRLCNSGVWIKAGSDRLTIQDNTFSDVLTNWSFNLMKSGEAGIDGDIETGCAYVDPKYSGRGLVVRRNRIEGLFDGAHVVPVSANDARSNETDFYQNVVESACDDFVEVDGIARNVRVFENRMNRSLSGVSMAQALDGPTFVIYNVLANCGMVRAVQMEGCEGYPFKTNGGVGPEIGSGRMFLYHNTAWTADPESRALLIKNARWVGLTLRNNIWCGRKLGLDIWMAYPSPIDMDYDDLYVEADGAPLVTRAGGSPCATLANVRQSLGFLRHGISANPGFTDAARGEYALKPSSPCVDAGVVLPGINETRTQGKAPDLGAIERP